MKFLPAQGFILIKRDDPDKVTKGGILIPNAPLQPFGEIIEVGGYSEYEVGQRIMFRKYVTAVDLDEVEYLIIEDVDILGILPKEEPKLGQPY